MNTNPLVLEEGAKNVIDEAVKTKAIVLMQVVGFITADEALLLRDMLWYAYKKGVTIKFLPQGKDPLSVDLQSVQ